MPSNWFHFSVKGMLVTITATAILFDVGGRDRVFLIVGNLTALCHEPIKCNVLCMYT